MNANVNIKNPKQHHKHEASTPIVGTHVKNGVATLSFSNAPYHYMDEVLIDKVDNAFDALIKRDDVRAIILTNADAGFFITHYSLDDIQKNTRIMAGMARLNLPVAPLVRPSMAFARRVFAIRRVPVLKQLLFNTLKRTPLGGTLVYAQVNAFIEKLRTCSKPVIAAIGGNAQGVGMEIALACDFRIMARGDYHLGQIESLVGLIPGSGGAQHLSRMFGTAKALELSMLGTRLNAEHAKELGLVYQAVEPEQLQTSAQNLGEQLAQRTPESLAYIKQCVNLGHDKPLNKALRMDEEGFLVTAATASALGAFQQNRDWLNSGVSVNDSFTRLEQTDLNGMV